MQIPVSTIMPLFDKVWIHFIVERPGWIDIFDFQDWVAHNCGCKFSNGGKESDLSDEFFIFDSEIEYNQFLLKWG